MKEILMFDPYKKLRDAFRKKNLTLYLGAGVSTGSKLPSWEKLILAMYFKKINEQEMDGWLPYSNYLYAIAEWHLENCKDPFEITARKLYKYYILNSEEKFLEDLHQTLYGNFLRYGLPFPMVMKEFIRHNNPTLDSVTRLCEASLGGIRAVVTYNFDNMLEISLGDFNYQSIFCSTPLNPGTLPIYHVHGYIPLDRSINSSKVDEIVFTEDQYHQVAENPYYWSNLIQLQLISSSVGLMVGLSLSDRNIRRLLDAVKNSPINSINYALLKEPDTILPNDQEIEKIHNKAIEYLGDFERSGIKSEQNIHNGILFRKPGAKSTYPRIKSSRIGLKGPKYKYEIAGIIEQVQLFAKDQQQYVLKQLGITPIWYKEFSDIPRIIEKIYS